MVFDQFDIKKKIYFIAEIGINHNGDVSIAKKIIKNAKLAGFDAVKSGLHLPIVFGVARTVKQFH